MVLLPIRMVMLCARCRATATVLVPGSLVSSAVLTYVVDVADIMDTEFSFAVSEWAYLVRCDPVL